MQYDKNGNILNLQRNGNYDDPVYNLQIDNLSYFYDTSLSNLNRLMKVTDLSNDPNGFKDGINTNDDFSYDDNGNLILDQNKNITNIKYNILNLPVEIIFSNNTTKKINYIYNSEGVKIRKIVTNGTIISTTDYLNGFQYYKATSAAAVVLKYFPTDEGYVSVTTSGTTNNYNYVFTYKDHLGNVRVSYGFGSTSSNPNGATYILQESNYYPFGLGHSNYNTDKLTYDDNIANGIAGSIVIPPLNYPLNKYKYNGIEYQDELGLNMYDYGARNYDAAIGRWMNLDNSADYYTPNSPYAYCFNNPIFYIDPDGNDPTPYEAALIAAHVYGNSTHGLTGGWHVSSMDLGYNNKTKGFTYGLYERTIKGKTEYVLAYAGTDDSDDIVDDINQVAGLSNQYKAASKLATKVNKKIGNNTLVFVGHSLGGGLSNLSSKVTGRSSITFNPAWLSNSTRFFNKSNIKSLSKGNYIHNYVNRLDPLDKLQQTSLAHDLGLRSDGDKFRVGDYFDYFTDDVYEGHSIDTMIEEMDGGGLYNIVGEQEDDYRDEERTRDDDYEEVSQSSRYY